MNDLYAAEPSKSEDVNLTIRIPVELRDAFANICTVRGTNTSRVLRNFIATEVAKTKSATAAE